MFFYKKKKEEKIVKDEIRKDSDNVLKLYDEAIILGDIIINNLKQYDSKLDEGITMNQFDRFMRLSIYLLRLKIFASPKYDANQLKILQRIWNSMAKSGHTFVMIQRFNIDELYNKKLDEVEKTYMEKIEFCEYMFMNSEEHSLADYLQTPTSIFYFDYVDDTFYDMQEVSNKIKAKSQKPDKFNAEIFAGIAKSFTEFDDNHLEKTIQEILNSY